MNDYHFDFQAVKRQALARRRSMTIDVSAERKGLGLSQRAFAKLAGIAAPTLKTVENGKRKPRKRTIEKIENTLRDMNSDRIANGDMIRRQLMNNGALIGTGKVPCPGDGSKCDGGCMACKAAWLRQPYKEMQPNQK